MDDVRFIRAVPMQHPEARRLEGDLRRSTAKMAVNEQNFTVRVKEVCGPFLAEIVGKGYQEIEARFRRRHFGN
jgi:hypothetical protein